MPADKVLRFSSYPHARASADMALNTTEVWAGESAAATEEGPALECLNAAFALHKLNRYRVSSCPAAVALWVTLLCVE